MKTKKPEFFANQTSFFEAADKPKKQDNVMSELGLSKGTQTNACLPFGYGEGSVLYLAADFDAPLEDFSEYS